MDILKFQLCCNVPVQQIVLVGDFKALVGRLACGEPAEHLKAKVEHGLP